MFAFILGTLSNSISTMLDKIAHIADSEAFYQILTLLMELIHNAGKYIVKGQ